jgi:hypothetical protein
MFDFVSLPFDFAHRTNRYSTPEAPQIPHRAPRAKVA